MASGIGVFFFLNSKLQDSSSSCFENVHNHKILHSRFFLLKKAFIIKRTSSSGFWGKKTQRKTENYCEKIGKNHQFSIDFLIQFFKNLVKGQNQLL
jgi:hypothetical protein